MSTGITEASANGQVCSACVWGAVDFKPLPDIRQYMERCSSSDRPEDTALYVLRGSATKQRGPAGSANEQQEDVKASLEPVENCEGAGWGECRYRTGRRCCTGWIMIRLKAESISFTCVQLFRSSKIWHYRTLEKVKDGAKGRGAPLSPSFSCSHYAA